MRNDSHLSCISFLISLRHSALLQLIEGLSAALSCSADMCGRYRGASIFARRVHPCAASVLQSLLSYACHCLLRTAWGRLLRCACLCDPHAAIR